MRCFLKEDIVQKMSDYLKKYCQGCGSFFVNGDENVQRMLKADEQRIFIGEVLVEPEIFQKIEILKKCSCCRE